MYVSGRFRDINSPMITAISYIGFILLGFIGISGFLCLRGAGLGAFPPVIVSIGFHLISWLILLFSPQIPKWHSIWLFFMGYLIGIIAAWVMGRDMPLLSPLLKLFARFVGGIAQAGIPRERIEEAQFANFRAAIDRRKNV